MEPMQQAAGRRRRTRRPDAETAPPEDTRPPLRPEMREEEPRAAAKKRAAEILQHIGSMDEGTDDFYVSPSQVPDGWTYEWKRKTVYNAEDPAYQVALARTGWEPVPARRHPDMMPTGWKGDTIERKGMVLMQRPKEITDRVLELDQRRARNQVRAKEQQLAAAPPGTMEKEYSDPRTRPNIKKNFEAMPIPADK
jgi:hypothetical protein